MSGPIPAVAAAAAHATTAQARAIVLREGRGALLPFQGAPGMSLFVSRSGRAVLAHARAGGLEVVLGDPIGPASEAAATMAEFVGRSRRVGHAVAVYQATSAAQGFLREAGFERIFCIGREAILDLGSFTLHGSRRANLRHTVTRFHRDGATIHWFPEGLDDGVIARFGDELAEIDRTWQVPAGPQLSFTIGSFHSADLPRSPIAIAADRSGRATGFVTFQATGTDRGFVVDLIRRLPTGAPGAIEACIAEAAIAMGAAGSTRLSLGLAPVSGLDLHHGPFEERAIRLAASAVRRWYDVDGLAFFKAKFDPRWEPRYIAARHRRDAVAVSLALLRLHLRRHDEDDESAPDGQSLDASPGTTPLESASR